MLSPSAFAPAVIVPLILWRLYARTRRSIGRQPIRPKRMWTRVGFLSVIAVLVALQGFVDPRLAAGLAAGIVGGAVLGIVALKLTRFEIDGKQDGYVPNLWIGLGLSALFIGRLIYRFMVIWPEMSHAAKGGVPAFERSPLTLVILGLLIGYYIAYYAGLLIHHRRALAIIRAQPPAR